MTLLVPSREATFGSGGSEPYAAALAREGRLTLVGDSRRSPTIVAEYDLGRWMADADDIDLGLLASASGSVLDIGCGPGRMVRAAADLGLAALGLDVSEAAVAFAREAGLPVVQGSVFDRVPREGSWGVALLLDGNIGIGGDAAALLRRSSQLIDRDGVIIVEVQYEADLDTRFTAHIVDDRGHESASFPWAEVGSSALARHASTVGLRVDETWVVGGRTFCRLSRRLRRR